MIPNMHFGTSATGSGISCYIFRWMLLVIAILDLELRFSVGSAAAVYETLIRESLDDIQDLHEVGVATDLLLDSVHDDDSVALLAQAEFLGVLDGAEDNVLSALEAGDLETDDASANLEVSAGGLSGRQSQDGLGRSVLGQESSGVSSLSEGNDELAAGIGSGLDSGRSH